MLKASTEELLCLRISSAISKKQNAKQMPPRTGRGSQADTQHGAILKERWNRPNHKASYAGRNQLDHHRSLSSDYLSIPAARPKYLKTSSGESSKASHPIETRPPHTCSLSTSATSTLGFYLPCTNGVKRALFVPFAS